MVLQIYWKETSTHAFACEYFKSFRGSFFHRTTPVAAFEVNFSIRKGFSKK